MAATSDGDGGRLDEAPVRTVSSWSWGRRLGCWLLLAVLLAIGVELSASIMLAYADRWRPETRSPRDVSRFSVVNVVHRLGLQLGLAEAQPSFDYRRSITPGPFYRNDPALGFVPNPGRYVAGYERRARLSARWERLTFQITINPDGSRWTGPGSDEDNPSVYVFGGSDTFGAGVNDEQTFSALLQRARPDTRVRLFAAGGYGLIHSFISFNRLRDTMRSGEIVVLAYSDVYDGRNVVAPSHLRYAEDFNRRLGGTPGENRLLPKADVAADGTIRIAYVQQLCSLNNGYCAGRDPDPAEMTRISAALINDIARRAPGPVYLVHLIGKASNPVFGLLSASVTHVSALPKDFDYFMHDNIAGFDDHPGPYWHYAVSRKLIEALRPRP